jgi:hypothetical protein
VVRSRITAGQLSTSALQSTQADIYLTQVLYASAAELTQDGTAHCAQTPPLKTVTGTVSGVPAGAYGIMSFGYTSEIFDGSSPTNPVLFSVPPGPQDFLGSRVINPGAAPDKLLLMRNLNIPDGGSLPAIDYNGASSFAPATATVTITGAAAGEVLETYVDLVTANGIGGMWSDMGPSPATTRTWAGLPTAVMMTTDYHGLTVFAGPQDNPFDFRVTLRFVGPVSNQTVALGAALTLPTTAQVAAGAYPRYRFQGPLPAEYNSGVTVTLAGGQESANFYGITATNGYLAAAGNALAYDFTMADISTVAGFPLAARLLAGNNLLHVSAYGFNAPGIFDPEPVLNSEFKAAAKSTTIIVP